MNKDNFVYDGNGERLDIYPQFSREFIKKYINSGSVMVNGKKPSHR